MNRREHTRTTAYWLLPHPAFLYTSSESMVMLENLKQKAYFFKSVNSKYYSEKKNLFMSNNLHIVIYLGHWFSKNIDIVISDLFPFDDKMFNWLIKIYINVYIHVTLSYFIVCFDFKTVKLEHMLEKLHNENFSSRSNIPALLVAMYLEVHFNTIVSKLLTLFIASCYYAI